MPVPVGEIITFNEGAVPFSADDLRDLLGQVNPEDLRTRLNATMGRNVVALEDDPNGLYLRWTGSLPQDTRGFSWGRGTAATQGEPPIQIDRTIKHVQIHQRELARLGTTDVTIPQHSVFIVQNDPYYRAGWPVVYSVVENIPEPELIGNEWFNKIKKADHAQLLKLGKSLVDYYVSSPVGVSVLHEDTARAWQYNHSLTLYDIEPRLTTEATPGITAVSTWAKDMRRNSPEREELLRYINQKLYKIK
ncbi:MAG TPA: hypothetical protein VFB59_04725 [Candidatus Saccharimonadales bacterium]|nr:hypothetical protein [Candidatus Saccharimonadales bacterium]